MDRAAIQKWFSALTQHQKVIALLIIMREITIVMRTISITYPNDSETRWRLAYHLSEMNHAFTQAAWAMMENRSTYPDNVLIEIVLEQDHYPEIAADCRYVMDEAMRFLNNERWMG